MFSSDLAKLYQCSNGTKSINLAVKRHINRFPERFMFQLSSVEISDLCSRFQIETLNHNNNKRGYNIKYLPYVFTEESVAMLATVLRTEVAAKISIDIMDAFVAMRKYMGFNLIEQKNINTLLISHDNRITLLEESFSKFEEKKKTNEIYFKGQIYDAYSKIIEILKEAKKEIIIIDSYADKTTLDIIRNLDVKVFLIINESSRLTKLDIEKYNEQYNNLKLVYDNDYHDRYFILDSNVVYHLGTSINNAGSKTFSVNKLEDKIVIEKLIENVHLLIKNDK